MTTCRRSGEPRASREQSLQFQGLLEEWHAEQQLSQYRGATESVLYTGVESRQPRGQRDRGLFLPESHGTARLCAGSLGHRTVLSEPRRASRAAGAA